MGNFFVAGISSRMKIRIYVCFKLTERRAFDIGIHTFCANAKHSAAHTEVRSNQIFEYQSAESVSPGVSSRFCIGKKSQLNSKTDTAIRESPEASITARKCGNKLKENVKGSLWGEKARKRCERVSERERQKYEP